MTSRRATALGAGVALAALVALGGLWLARKPVTTAVVDTYLTRKGVPGRYRISQLDGRSLVLTDIALGPVAAPDFTARRVVIDYGLGLSPKVSAVRIEDAMLKARVDAQGKITLGALESLRPPPDDEPLRLPPIRVELDGGRLRLGTPAGGIEASVSASGRLDRRFSARLTSRPAHLLHDGVALDQARVDAKIEGRDGALRMDASLAAAAASKGPIGARGLALRLIGDAPKTLDRWRGDWALAVAATHAPDAEARAFHASGRAGLDASGAAMLTARLDAGALSLAPRRRATLLSTLPDGAGPPLAPILTAIRRRPACLLPEAARAAARLRFEWLGRSGRLSVTEADYGDVLHLRSAGGLTVTLPTLAASASRLDLRLRPCTLDAVTARATNLSAGGGAPLRLSATIGPARWSAGTAQLALEPAGIELDGRRWRYAGGLALSGPVGGGRLDRLALPFMLEGSADGALLLKARSGCANLTLAGLDLPAGRLGALRQRICASDGGPLLRMDRDRSIRSRLAFTDLALAATSGKQSARLRADRLTLDVSGAATAPVVIAQLSGGRVEAELAGPGKVDAVLPKLSASLAADGSARIGIAGAAVSGPALPAALSAAEGRFALDKTGAATGQGLGALITDTAKPSRFNPLRLSGGVMTLARGRLSGEGALLLAAKAQKLGDVSFEQDLATAKGAARFSVAALTFSPKLELYEISELVRGQVENASGAVSIEAEVAWGGAITSRATVTFDHLGFATAALGPIEGVVGRLEFDDLFAFTTQPDQQLTVASINPGVAVLDGHLRFQLLPGGKLAVAQAAWPFAAGELFLEPVVIDPAAVERRLVFRARNVDAAGFLQMFQLENLNVTGSIDGVFPVVVSGSGVRIEHGSLRAQAGGVIQYVGEVGNSVSGASKLAFDALKNFQYDKIELEFDGDLAGELVTAIRFSGRNGSPVGLRAGVPVKTTRLPFQFNVSVRAPFRSLLNSAAGFSDARVYLKQATPVDLSGVP